MTGNGTTVTYTFTSAIETAPHTLTEIAGRVSAGIERVGKGFPGLLGEERGVVE
jgi:hypothetical protein